MPFSFEPTNIKELLIIYPHIYVDFRGTYKKFYEREVFAENGISDEFCESSDIYSQKGALRGLHYQNGESQSKLIRVIKGSLYDVALDLRRDSETFGQYHAELLTEKDMKSIYIPRGFAHGFISLENGTVFSYQCAGRYVPELCGGIIWNDRELNINWPLKEYGIEQVIATDKDKTWQTFAEFKSRNKQE